MLSAICRAEDERRSVARGRVLPAGPTEIDRDAGSMSSAGSAIASGRWATALRIARHIQSVIDRGDRPNAAPHQPSACKIDHPRAAGRTCSLGTAASIWYPR
jgi:hypothetical protein